MQKGLFFAVAAVAASFVTSCVDVEKLTQFDLPYSTTITVPQLPYDPILSPPVNLSSPKFNTKIKDFFDQYQTARDLVNESHLEALSLTAQADASNPSPNFDFAKSVKLYINASGMPEKELASRDSIPFGTSVLTFTTSKVNLTEYVVKDSISVRMSGVQRGANATSFKAKCDLKFHVDAKVLGK